MKIRREDQKYYVLDTCVPHVDKSIIKHTVIVNHTTVFYSMYDRACVPVLYRSTPPLAYHRTCVLLHGKEDSERSFVLQATPYVGAGPHSQGEPLP